MAKSLWSLQSACRFGGDDDDVALSQRRYVDVRRCLKVMLGRLRQKSFRDILPNV